MLVTVYSFNLEWWKIHFPASAGGYLYKCVHLFCIYKDIQSKIYTHHFNGILKKHQHMLVTVYSSKLECQKFRFEALLEGICATLIVLNVEFQIYKEQWKGVYLPGADAFDSLAERSL